jgi:hypothetical protein
MISFITKTLSPPAHTLFFLTLFPVVWCRASFGTMQRTIIIVLRAISQTIKFRDGGHEQLISNGERFKQFLPKV